MNLLLDAWNDPLRAVAFGTMFFYAGLVCAVARVYVPRLFAGGPAARAARHVTALATSVFILLVAFCITLIENLGTGFHLRLVLLPLAAAIGVYGLGSLIYRLPR